MTLSPEQRAALALVMDAAGSWESYGDPNEEPRHGVSEAIATLQAMLDEKGGRDVTGPRGNHSTTGTLADQTGTEANSGSQPLDASRPQPREGGQSDQKAGAVPPPDSPAKIAADLREVGSNWQQSGYVTDGDRLQQFAARVEALGEREVRDQIRIKALEGALALAAPEPRGKQHTNTQALGLEPSEREVVRQATLQAKTLSEWINSCFNNAELCADPECEPCDGVRKLTGIIAALAPIAERKEGT